jgi:PAS domain-containing protein
VPHVGGSDQRVRRLPFRFVWQMDATTRFTLGTEDFAKAIGPKTAALLDRPWGEIAASLQLDPQGQIVRALASHDTWSGIVVMWPVDDSDERLPIEMSGLPVFDRDRQFAGYRGFGICRDTERLEALQRRRAEPKQPPPAPPMAEEPEATVLPFPVPPLPEPEPAPPSVEAPTLSAGEHSAFQELARELSERLKKGPGTPPPAEVPVEPFVAPPPAPPKAARNGDASRDTHEGRPILDRLPVGLLVYRLNNLVYANRAFLDWTGYPTLEALAEAGGLDSLFIESREAPVEPPAKNGAANGAKTLTITTVNGKQKPVEGRLFSVSWNNENALVLMINTQPAVSNERSKTAEAGLRRLEEENRQLKSVLDTATDGVLVLDRAGRGVWTNPTAPTLVG